MRKGNEYENFNRNFYDGGFDRCIRMLEHGEQ